MEDLAEDVVVVEDGGILVEGEEEYVHVCFSSFLYAHHLFSFYNTRLFYIFLYLHVHRGVICLAEEVEVVGEVDLGEAAVAATKEYYS